jgi:uncharacterized damage-inducible protein DinB
MYHTIQEFLDEWNEEQEATIKIFSSLTDSSLQQKVTPEGRSLGTLAWHIVTSLGEMGGKSGLIINAPPEDEPVPSHAKEILDAYKNAGDSLGLAVQEQWSDALLLETIELYGERWTRSETLHMLITHLIHHRAQMTVLMRQAGLKVPGIYGPSREEWATLGLPPAE